MDPENERFRSIYMNYMPLMRVIARRRGIPYDEIDDIVQETFAAFFSHYAEKLDNMTDTDVKRTLCVIIRNRSIDYLRRKATHPMEYFDPVSVQGQRFGTNEEGVLYTLMKDQTYQDVMDAIRNMKRDWSEVFILLALEERPIAEVSERLGISQAACRTRLSRARKYLREELKNYQPFFSEREQQEELALRKDESSGKKTGTSEYSKIPESMWNESHLRLD